MSVKDAVRMDIEIDLSAPVLRTSGEPDQYLVARVLHELALKIMQYGLTPGGVWGGSLARGPVHVGHWTIHTGE